MIYNIYSRDSTGNRILEAKVDVSSGRVSWDRHSDVEDLLPSLSLVCGKSFDPTEPEHWKLLPGVLNGSRLWVEPDNGEVIMKAKIILKGGAGSGHHGHQGLTGVWGGSAPSGGGKSKGKKISKKPAKSQRTKVSTLNTYIAKGWRVSSVDKKEGWTILQKGKHAVIINADGSIKWDSEARGAAAYLPGLKWREFVERAKEFISKYEDEHDTPKIKIILKGRNGR